MKFYSSLLLIILWSGVTVFSKEKKDLLQRAMDRDLLKEVLDTKRTWVPYPDYHDRRGWGGFTGDFKDDLIRSGEKMMDYQWQVVRATDYLAYERNGTRATMEGIMRANNTAFSTLLLAEMAEGKGRFLDQIINGVFFYCEMTSWVLSAHLPAFQTSKRSLPDYREHVIDLMSGDVGSMMSWTYYFLHKEFDKVDPVIAERLQESLRARILQPYMDRSDYWWQAFNLKPGQLVNNWNPWCNFNVLTTFLLLEEDSEKMLNGVYRTMVSVDKFINYTKEDGACEEGPSYWGHAAGKLFDYLSVLDYATKGELPIFQEPKIKRMGEYIARSYVGNGWVVNFADATAKSGGDPGLIYRYGDRIDSKLMLKFSSYLRQARPYNISAGRDIFRTMENLKCYDKMMEVDPSLPEVSHSWYPQTQFCFIRTKKDMFFAAKGGFNNESHNHNDVGTFSLYYKNTPFFIDAGVGTYTKKTFSKERYTIWTMQSDYHNVPKINGYSQSFGTEFKATGVAFDPEKNTIAMDISGAYPADAGINAWWRTYTIKDDNVLIIQDEFSLDEIKQPNKINFLVWKAPDLRRPGEMIISVEGMSLLLKYDDDQFTVKTEKMQQTDPRLSRIWGSEVFRITFTAKDKVASGKYNFTIQPD